MALQIHTHDAHFQAKMSPKKFFKIETAFVLRRSDVRLKRVSASGFDHRASTLLV